MKKILSVLLSTAMLVALLSVSSAADTCAHIYTSAHFPKNCVSPAKTVYTCKLCGYTYTVFDSEYNTPENFAIVYESVRDDKNMTLTVTATVLNNPGLIVARTRLGYNADTLKPISFENGTVWDDDDYFMNINLSSNPITVYTEERTEELDYRTGLYYTFVFSILDADGDYGISVTARKSDFSDNILNTYQPEVINIIGTTELGEHSFGEPETVLEPTFDTVGKTASRCIYCDEERFSDIPVLQHWKRGDLNNDNKVNAGDCSTLKKVIVGKVSCTSLQMRDAADLNRDNKINAGDAAEIKRVIVGK